MALKCDVSNEGVKILCEGGIDDMVGDLMALINSLYSSLLQSNTVGANFFKYAMTHAVSDSISPPMGSEKKCRWGFDNQYSCRAF